MTSTAVLAKRIAHLFSVCALAACATAPSPGPTTDPLSKEMRFGGKIEAVNDGCLADGICSLTIAGTTVVWMVGWSQDIWGQVSVERTIGTPVEVYCRKTEEGCELRGSPDYYVRRRP